MLGILYLTAFILAFRAAVVAKVVILGIFVFHLIYFSIKSSVSC